MSHSFIVIEFKLIFFNCPFKHYSYQHPRTYIKAGQFDKYFAFSLTYFNKAWPVHLLISSFNDSVTNSKQVFTGVSAKNVFGLDLPGFENGFLCLLVILSCHYLQLLGGFSQRSFLILQLIGGSGKFIRQLFVLLS